MKVHEAIIASAPETLNARQGFGLVRCYRNLPLSVQKRIQDWSYPSEMNGREIFTFCHQEAEGETWFLLNRTGQATDFTGRSSYISHSICFRERELKKWIEDCPPAILGPADILLRFPWETTWSKPSPEWIEEDQLKSLEDYGVQSPTIDTPPESGDCNLLSAFSADSNGRLVGNRCYWLSDKADEREQLNDFRRAWHSADPWKAFPELQNKLGEDYGPTYHLGISWAIQFTTHLRSERPDPYHWVVAPLGTKVPNGRVALRQDHEGWKAEAANNSGSLGKVGERCSNPEGWAKNLIHERILRISEERNQQESAIRSEFNEFRHDVTDELKEKRDKLQQSYLDEGQSKFKTSEELSAEWKTCHDWIKEKRVGLNNKYAETENRLSQLNESTEAVRSLTQLASQLRIDSEVASSEEGGLAHQGTWIDEFDHQADELMREFFCAHALGARADEKARLREEAEGLANRERDLEDQVTKLNESAERVERERNDLVRSKVEEAKQGNDIRDTKEGLQKALEENQKLQNRHKKLTDQAKTNKWITAGLVTLTVVCMWALMTWWPQKGAGDPDNESSQLAQLQQTNENLDEQIEDFKKQEENLNEVVKELKRKLATIEDLEGENQKLKKQVEDLNKALDETKRKLVTKDGEIKRLENKIRDADRPSTPPATPFPPPVKPSGEKAAKPQEKANPGSPGKKPAKTHARLPDKDPAEEVPAGNGNTPQPKKVTEE